MLKKKKPKFDIFFGIQGCRVSVLFDHFQARGAKTKESYFGTVIGRSNGFLIIEPDERSFVTAKNVEKVVLREDQILSFWIYNSETGEPKP